MTASRRIYLAYFALAVAVALGAVGFVVLVQRQQAIAFQAQFETVERTSDALATHIQANVRAALLEQPMPQGVAAVQAQLDGYKALGDVFNIRVSRSDRQVVAAVRRKNLEKPESLPIMLDAIAGKRGNSFETVDGVRNFCVALPIELAGSPWGAVVLYRNLEPMYATAQVANQRILWGTVGTFFMLLLSIGAVLLLAAREVRRAQDAEARQARLALMGTMAASVAHEIRNPLNSLNLSIEYLRRRAQTGLSGVEIPQDVLEDFSSMQHEVKRLEQVVRDFSDLAKTPHIETRIATLDGAIEHVVRLFQPLARERQVKLEFQPATKDMAVNVDSNRMEQVLVNLVKNALEATPAHGKVHIKTRREDDRLMVEVVDNGPGIPPKEQARVFEPFYTTRASGLGLGLYLSKRLVEAHRGTLSMSSEQGKGTVFRIALPLPGNSQAHLAA
jgi:signal transduction histidine kinase